MVRADRHPSPRAAEAAHGDGAARRWPRTIRASRL